MSGAAFVAWQLAWFALYAGADGPLRAVDKVISLAFVAWAAALLFLTATGGGAFAGQAVRERLDDELARARRTQAYRSGFWAMAAVALAGYAAAQLTPVAARDLAHVVVSAGVAAAVLTLAHLRRG
jgi:hypothetical protein